MVNCPVTEAQIGQTHSAFHYNLQVGSQLPSQLWHPWVPNQIWLPHVSALSESCNIYCLLATVSLCTHVVMLLSHTNYHVIFSCYQVVYGLVRLDFQIYNWYVLSSNVMSFPAPSSDFLGWMECTISTDSKQAFTFWDAGQLLNAFWSATKDFLSSSH